MAVVGRGVGGCVQRPSGGQRESHNVLALTNFGGQVRELGTPEPGERSDTQSSRRAHGCSAQSNGFIGRKSDIKSTESRNADVHRKRLSKENRGPSRGHT